MPNPSNLFNVLINGEQTEHISVYDRGLHYGDGVFETIAFIRGEMPLWQHHWTRLEKACEQLHIPLPGEDVLLAEAQQLGQQSERSVIKLLITRGSGGRGYHLPESAQSTRILIRYPWPDYPAKHWTQGIKTRVCDTRLGRNKKLAGLKHLNRLEQILARSEWSEADSEFGIIEGLLLDNQDSVIEAITANLFMIKKGTLYTPDLSYSGVAGIMRGLILDCAQKLGIAMEVTQLSLAQILDADELFITNSLIGVWPINAVDNHSFQLGPITQRLQDLMQEILPIRDV